MLISMLIFYTVLLPIMSEKKLSTIQLYIEKKIAGSNEPTVMGYRWVQHLLASHTIVGYMWVQHLVPYYLTIS
jgi:hypothetical protein